MIDTTVLIQRTHRVPALPAFKSKTDPVRTKLIKKLDGALLTIGFKLSPDLMKNLSLASPENLQTYSKVIINTAMEMVGGHVRHNVYFKDFPNNIPDTETFWAECIIHAIRHNGLHKVVDSIIIHDGINLLDLPMYGRYQHTFEDLVEGSEKFIPAVSDRLTIFNLGKTPDEETVDLYYSLLFSTVPLNDTDRVLLEKLISVPVCRKIRIIKKIPVRENKAYLNAFKILNNQKTIQIDTYTDVLRVAAALSNGDVTLATRVRFKSFKNYVRRGILTALNTVDSTKLPDIHRHTEVWKRLGERLHPRESDKNAFKVFEVARGVREARTLNSFIQEAFDQKKPEVALAHMRKAPGVLFRNLDWVIRSNPARNNLMKSIEGAVEDVSGRVLLSVYEHMNNRASIQGLKRLFTNTKGKTYVTDETRSLLDPSVVMDIQKIIGDELGDRLPVYDTLDIDNIMGNVALPLTEKNKVEGLNIFPRGSLVPIESSHSLRFFMYWHQTTHRTDYDLSLLVLDRSFNTTAQVSWTSLRHSGMVHSGDIVDAPDGASEFIDVPLKEVNSCYLVPQVNFYYGEDFNSAQEAFFGYMTRTRDQKGMPFEPKTVRMRSDLRNPKESKGKVVLPIMFMKMGDQWYAKWMHFYLTGSSWANSTEKNKVTSSLLVRGIVEKKYLTVGDIIGFMRYDKRKGNQIVFSHDGVTKNTNGKVFSLKNLHELIPA